MLIATMVNQVTAYTLATLHTPITATFLVTTGIDPNGGRVY